MNNKNRGLYGKYRVERVDGSSAPGGKHEECDYFVLDLTHDPHARAALKAYADSCRTDYPLLAADLDAKYPEAVNSQPFCGPFPAMSQDEYTLRYLLAMTYIGEGLYGDDGELQLGGVPHPIDFRRDSVSEIRRKIDARNWEKLVAALKAADDKEAHDVST